jgi:hypothetical protein
MHIPKTLRSLINLSVLTMRSRKLAELIPWAQRKRLKEQIGRYSEEQEKIEFLFSKLTPVQRIYVELVHLFCTALTQLTAQRRYTKYRKKRR